MATTVHIPLSKMELALDRARAGDRVMLDGEDESFRLERVDRARKFPPFSDVGPIHIERTDFRPLDEILADPNKKWSNVRMDDEWASDMEAVMAENRAHDRDPWAE